MGQCLASPAASAPCANGSLVLSSRVQTQYTRDEGGDGLWYTGSITGLWNDGSVAVQYDDGDSWRGRAIYCYLLPAGSPGMTQLQPYGVPSQGCHVRPPGEVAQAVPVRHAFQPGEGEPREPAVIANVDVAVGRPVVGRPV